MGVLVVLTPRIDGVAPLGLESPGSAGYGRNDMKAIVFGILAAALGLLPGAAGAAAPAPQEGGTLKIVSSLPRTGSANPQTTTIVNGIKMAFEDAGWKAGSWKIRYEDWDDASAKKGDWDPEVEAANAEKAIKDPDVMIYIGTYNSGAAKISMPVLNKASIAMISPANTYPGLTKPGKGEPNEPGVYRPSGRVNYCRVVPADDIQGTVAADWAKKLGAKRVFILDDRGLYGKGVADVFEARCAEIDLEVLGHEGIDPKAQEYKSLMTKIKGKSPDLVYFGGTTQSNGGQVAKDMIAVGLTCKLMVPDGCCEKAFITSAGAENVHLHEEVLRGTGGVRDLRLRVRPGGRGRHPPGRKEGSGRDPAGGHRDEGFRRGAGPVVLRRKRGYDPQDHERQRDQGRRFPVRGGLGRRSLRPIPGLTR